MKYSRLILTLSIGAICSLTLDKFSQTKASIVSNPQDIPQATQNVLTNSTPITIHDAAIASPYPSTVTVSGLSGAIPATPGSVKVTLCDFSHAFPNDVGIVLVGPTGAALLLQDGAGDDPNMAQVTYTLSDSGATPLPDLTAWTAGTYKPTTYYTGENFPAPGPGMSYSNPGPAGGGTATFSSTFGGTNPNGTWRLYVVDFVSADAGSIGCGWSLEINTSTTPVVGSGTLTGCLTGPQEVPSNASAGTGVCAVTLNSSETQINVSCTYQGLSSNLQAAHIHGNAAPGVNAGVLFSFGVTGGASGTFTVGPFAVTPAQVANMRAHLWYINLHSVNFPGGEIRGQVKQANTVFDVDCDGRTELTVFRQSANQFYTLHSLTNTFQAITFGSGAGDIWLNNTADFDGDGRGDLLLLKLDGASKAAWSILRSSTNTVQTTLWGDFSAGVLDTLAISDYDGDGREDIAVFRRSTGVWYIIESSTGTPRIEPFGAVDDFPSVGDYDGDGRSDLTVVRVETGQRVWYIRQSSDLVVRRVVWGSSATDGVFFFAPFDVDGDGKQDIAVNRTVAGQRVFFIQRSSDGAQQNVTWGAAPASTALFGDYDGDGKTDFVARQVIGGAMTWNILQSSNGAHRTVQWGITGDQ